MYVDIRGSLYRVCLLLRVRMWSFWDPLFFVFALSYFFKGEMNDFLLRTLGYCLFHYYIHYWCDFILCLTWVDHHFSLYIHCLWFIWFASFPCPFLILTYYRFDISLASLLRISLLVWFASLSHYWYYIHIGHLQVHVSWAFLYMLHFIHEGMSFLSLGIWT